MARDQPPRRGLADTGSPIRSSNEELGDPHGSGVRGEKRKAGIGVVDLQPERPARVRFGPVEIEVRIGMLGIDTGDDGRHLGDVIAHHGGEIGLVLDRDEDLAGDHFS